MTGGSKYFLDYGNSCDKKSFENKFAWLLQQNTRTYEEDNITLYD